LRECGVTLATTPNFSLFVDRPRWDDLHSIKRIALAHWEFLDEGLAAALHVNGRTEMDFHRWAEFLGERPEITHIAYEFTTGTGRSSRRGLHVDWLCGLVGKVGRPLHLVIRGGMEALQTLYDAFDGSITVLETSAFIKTMMQQRAAYSKESIAWLPAPTAVDEPLDELYEANRQMVSEWICGLVPVSRPATTADSAIA
jgi:hypothetical protein